MANEYLKHFLDQQGLGIVWEKVKGLVTAEEVRAKLEEARLEGLISAEQARAIAAEATKVDKTVQGTNGKAIIFNEADGGGAKFEHNDGTWSFTGVNDGGKDGVAAQIYAVDSNAGYKGSKLDVTTNGIFYTSGDASLLPAAQRDVSDNEVVVWADIKNIPGGMRFIGVGELLAGQELEAAIKATYEDNHYAYPGDRKVGDIVILADGTEYKEFIYTTAEGWVELGDSSLYATKVELATEAAARISGDATLQGNIEAEAATRAAEDAKKVDKEIATAGVGKAIIFNEADGGGAKYEKADGTASFVGVNQDTNGGIGAQLYDIDVASNKGTKIDVTKNGVYYTKGDDSALPAAQRDVAANELVTQSQVNELASGKVDKPVEPVSGKGVNVPYFFSVDYTADKATVKDYTVDLLDNTKAPQTFSLDINAATASLAGLMVAADKDKLDGLIPMTDAEIEAICQ